MPPQFQNQFNPTIAPKPSRSHKFLVVLTFLLFLSGAYAIWYSFNLPPEPEPENLSVTTTDEFADWKTYRNEEYGFEFKYPNDLIIRDYKSEKFLEFYHEEPLEATEYPSLSFNIEDNPNNLSIKEFFDGQRQANLYEQTMPEAITPIKIGGVEGIKFDPYISFAGGEVIVLPLDSAYLIVHDMGGTFKSLGILDQIFSTFKFISTSTPTQGNYKLGSVLVILEASANRVDFDKFVKDNNLKILLETKNQNLIEVQVPEGQEQIFVDRIKNVTGVESSLLNYYASFDI